MAPEAKAHSSTHKAQYMSNEKNAWDAVHQIYGGVGQLWLWLLTTGAITAAVVYVGKEFLVGLFNKIGEWVATTLLAKKKVQFLTEKAEAADNRGVLHKFLAEELHKLNLRLDDCDRRHAARDRNDELSARKLVNCHERREELEIKSVRLTSELRSAAIENATLVGQNVHLRSKLDKG